MTKAEELAEELVGNQNSPTQVWMRRIAVETANKALEWAAQQVLPTAKVMSSGTAYCDGCGRIGKTAETIPHHVHCPASVAARIRSGKSEAR